MIFQLPANATPYSTAVPMGDLHSGLGHAQHRSWGKPHGSSRGEGGGGGVGRWVRCTGGRGPIARASAVRSGLGGQRNLGPDVRTRARLGFRRSVCRRTQPRGRSGRRVRCPGAGRAPPIPSSSTVSTSIATQVAVIPTFDGIGVLGHVRQRLGRDEVGGRFHHGRESAPREFRRATGTGARSAKLFDCRGESRGCSAPRGGGRARARATPRSQRRVLAAPRREAEQCRLRAVLLAASCSVIRARTSRCWAPSWRSRTTRLRCSSPAVDDAGTRGDQLGSERWCWTRRSRSARQTRPAVFGAGRERLRLDRCLAIRAPHTCPPPRPARQPPNRTPSRRISAAISPPSVLVTVAPAGSTVSPDDGVIVVRQSAARSRRTWTPRTLQPDIARCTPSAVNWTRLTVAGAEHPAGLLAHRVEHRLRLRALGNQRRDPSQSPLARRPAARTSRRAWAFETAVATSSAKLAEPILGIGRERHPFATPGRYDAPDLPIDDDRRPDPGVDAVAGGGLADAAGDRRRSRRPAPAGRFGCTSAVRLGPSSAQLVPGPERMITDGADHRRGRLRS